MPIILLKRSNKPASETKFFFLFFFLAQYAQEVGHSFTFLYTTWHRISKVWASITWCNVIKSCTIYIYIHYIIVASKHLFSSSDFQLSLSSCIKTEGGSETRLHWQHNNLKLLSVFEQFKVIYNSNTLLTSLTQGVWATKQTFSQVSFKVETFICRSCSRFLILKFQHNTFSMVYWPCTSKPY